MRIVTPETWYLLYWTSVIGLVVLALISELRGVRRELRTALREDDS